jgi:hypothetical protein
MIQRFNDSMISPDTDPSLRRVERDAVVLCVGMAAVAYLLTNDARTFVAVIGGGVLIGVSYLSIKGAATALADLAAGGADAVRARKRLGWNVTKLALRYALLALLAYVMIGRLRMHPLALLAGASSVVAAVSVEAIRLLMKKP